MTKVPWVEHSPGANPSAYHFTRALVPRLRDCPVKKRLFWQLKKRRIEAQRVQPAYPRPPEEERGEARPGAEGIRSSGDRHSGEASAGKGSVTFVVIQLSPRVRAASCQRKAKASRARGRGTREVFAALSGRDENAQCGTMQTRQVCARACAHRVCVCVCVCVHVKTGGGSLASCEPGRNVFFQMSLE